MNKIFLFFSQTKHRQKQGLLVQEIEKEELAMQMKQIVYLFECSIFLFECRGSAALHIHVLRHFKEILFLSSSS